MPGDIYKNKTRIRVNGLLIDNKSILLAQIKSPVNDSLVWMPPGGGLHFGESVKECLKREFKEETGLEVSVHSLIAVNELVKPPFHAVEFYFIIKKAGGNLQLGNDPEHNDNEQILKDLKWILLEELETMNVAPESLLQWITNFDSPKESQDCYYQSK